MDGIINVLKPPGMTSQNVVSYVKRLLKADKAGHTGTLDPGAAGVLPVCLGRATRISEYLINDRKSYRAELRLGFSSDTLDKYGDIKEVNYPERTNEDIYRAFKGFEGRIEQVPPMYSAIKRDGVRLYDLARKGIVVEREVREAIIYKLDILYIKGDRVLFDVTCSKGTYIRSLCSDIGNALGSDGIMTFLLRTGTGPFNIENAVTLYDIEKSISSGNIADIIFPIFKGIESFSRVYVKNNTKDRVRNGVGFQLDDAVRFEKKEYDSILAIFDEDDNFIATGRNADGKGFIKIDKVFA